MITMTKWRYSLTVVIIATALAAGAWWVMSSNQKYTIEFIVPNEYRGVIILDEDPHQGVEPAIKDGNTYVYRVPETGRLAVKSFDLFEQYHFTIAEYADGQAISTDTSGGRGRNPTSPEDITLDTLGSMLEGKESLKIIICIGNLEDYRRYRKEYGFER